MNIILVGMSGSGKTTIGEELKKMQSMDLIDTDEEIKMQMGKEIEVIFREDGEEFFRDLETEILKKNKDKVNTIFSTGGGIVLKAENRLYLKEMGIRVLLKGNANTLVRNLKKSQEVRPLLKDTIDLKKDITKMINDRKEKYKDATDYEVIIDDKTIDEIVQEIINIINLVK